MITRKYILKLTRRGLAGLTVVMLFGAIWFFLLGVFVGRNSVPVSVDVNDIKKELALFIRNEKEKSGTESDVKGIDQKKELEFYENLKKNKIAKRLPHKETVPDRVNPSPSVSSAHATKDSNDKDTHRTVVRDGINEGEKGFTIQVASVKEEETADRMVSELKANGYSAYKTDAEIPNLGHWFRVRVGHYTNKEQARSTIEALKQKKFAPILLQE